jgi:hypothetical protein
MKKGCKNPKHRCGDLLFTIFYSIFMAKIAKPIAGLISLAMTGNGENRVRLG